MELTSEQIHWIDGALAVLLALFLILCETRAVNFRWSGFIVPAGLLIFGLGLVFDPLFHASDISESFGQEIRQHFWFGVIALVAGGVETGRTLKWFKVKFWAVVLPLGLILIGAGFFFHAQHQPDASMLLSTTQHRIMGVTLFLAAVPWESVN